MAQRGTINKVILVGYLGMDPEVRYMPSGDAVAEVRVATREVFKNREGEKVEKTEWHNLVMWRNTAEWAKEWLKKGQLVYVEGRLTTRQWEDRDGQKRFRTEIQVDQITPLGGLVGRDRAGGEIAPEEVLDSQKEKDIEVGVGGDEDKDKDDIPF
ncbi:MAG: single-stranded DNA-binding protein [Candidatus Neomarinimicrobiota bacterium]|nr:single-stranded DNA-binding protein [Candidatus Neomarinimicrobiota bacterium]RKY49807.1 MAG: single-stranded DNA-binding protein [Candidatus Neomarinimicrobiota bacterium]